MAVLRPKYGTGRLGRWLSSRLADPYCKGKLDATGSFVWRHCDGRLTIEEIARALGEHTRDKADDSRARLLLFFRHLERARMIGWAGTTEEHR